MFAHSLNRFSSRHSYLMICWLIIPDDMLANTAMAECLRLFDEQVAVVVLG